MIFHASFTTADPARTAQGIAAIWGGRAFRVPFIADGTWVAMAGDANGTVIEVLPRGTEFHHLPGQHLDIRKGANAGESGFHLLIGSPLSVEQVIATAVAHGFAAHPARHATLDVIEVWIDGCFLLEVLTPEQQANYRQQVTIEGTEALSAAAFPETAAG